MHSAPPGPARRRAQVQPRRPRLRCHRPGKRRRPLSSAKPPRACRRRPAGPRGGRLSARLRSLGSTALCPPGCPPAALLAAAEHAARPAALRARRGGASPARGASGRALARGDQRPGIGSSPAQPPASERPTRGFFGALPPRASGPPAMEEPPRPAPEREPSSESPPGQPLARPSPLPPLQGLNFAEVLGSPESSSPPRLASATFQSASYVSPPPPGRSLLRDPRRKSRSGLGLIGRHLGILPTRRGGHPGAHWSRAASVPRPAPLRPPPGPFSQAGARRGGREGVGGAAGGAGRQLGGGGRGCVRLSGLLSLLCVVRSDPGERSVRMQLIGLCIVAAQLNQRWVY